MNSEPGHSPNDPKLRDSGARRAGCRGRSAGAASVTCVAVLCSAWLGVLVGLKGAFITVFALVMAAIAWAMWWTCPWRGHPTPKETIKRADRASYLAIAVGLLSVTVCLLDWHLGNVLKARRHEATESTQQQRAPEVIQQSQPQLDDRQFEQPPLQVPAPAPKSAPAMRNECIPSVSSRASEEAPAAERADTPSKAPSRPQCFGQRQ